jgi:hypothetical protein
MLIGHLPKSISRTPGRRPGRKGRGSVLEGIVSKRIDMPYRSGPFRGWRKIKCAGYVRP